MPSPSPCIPQTPCCSHTFLWFLSARCAPLFAASVYSLPCSLFFWHSIASFSRLLLLCVLSQGCLAIKVGAVVVAARALFVSVAFGASLSWSFLPCHAFRVSVSVSTLFLARP